MAQYKVMSPDGQERIIEGPEGASDEEIIAQAQRLLGQPQAQPEPITQTQQQPGSGPETTAAGLAGAATRGLALPAAGALTGAAIGAPIGGVGAIPGAAAGFAAGALTQAVGDPVVQSINSILGTQYTLPSDALSDLLTRIGVSEPRTEAERIVQATAEAAGGAGGLAQTAKIVQQAARGPVTKAVAGALGEQQAAQTIAGGASGAATQATAEGGGNTTEQLLAGLAAGVGTGALAQRAIALPKAISTPLPVDQTVARAERLGVPVLTSDVLPPETFIGKTAQRVGERIPIAGTGSVRAAQQESRIEAVRDVLREYGAEDIPDVSADIMKDLIQKRSEDLSKYSTMKREVIGGTASTGSVPIPNLTRKIDEISARLRRENTEASIEAANRLDEIKQSGATGAAGRTLPQLEAFRRDVIAKAFKDDPARPISVSVRDIGEKAVRELYDPLRDDMGSYIQKFGEKRDYAKWRVANKRLSELKGELEMGTVKSVLKSGQATPEYINKLLFSKRPSELNQLYKGLTPDGRANARVSILSQVAQKAAYQTEDGVNRFSPERFNAEIKRLSPQIGVFFKGDDRQRIEGLSRVLSMTRRAGEAGVSTATGQEAVPFVAGSMLQSLLGSFLGSVAVASGIGTAARIYESAPVRDILVRLAKTKPNSSEERALAIKFQAAVQSQAAKDEEGTAR